MTVLSRQSILKYMQRKEDPLEIYTLGENGEKHTIPESMINSHTVNLTVGHIVGELDLLKIQEELYKTYGADVLDFLGLAGINPTRHRKLIENSVRILDLNHLENYSVEEEGGYSWIVKTTDNYVFSTRVVVDEQNKNKAKGIILHPEIYLLNTLNVKIHEKLYMIGDYLNKLSQYLYNLQEGLRNQKLNFDELNKKIVEILNVSKILRMKINSPINYPSTSFVIVWTEEFVRMPLDLTAVIHTKSRIARLGISSHPASGKVDAGFHNPLALELKNIGYHPVVLEVGEPIVELQFEELDQPTELGYMQRPGALYKKGITF